MASDKRRYLALTAICRFYMTCTALVLVAFGDHTLPYMIYLLLCGLALDALRHWFAPDVSLKIEAVVNELAKARAPNSPLQSDDNKSLRKCAYWYGGYASYVALLFLAPTLFGAEATERYLRFFAPAYDVIGHWVSAIPRHASQLNAAGYAQRALLAQHNYAVFFLFMLASVFRISKLALPLLTEGARSRIKRGEMNPGSEPISTKVILGMTGATILIYAVLVLVVGVDFEPRVRAWNTHVSNFPYFILALSACGISMLACLIYLALFRLRERAWIGVPDK